MMYYGAQYYRPPFPNEEVWKRDILHMKELGFTCVKHWAMWNWIEKEPGKFDFSELDKLIRISKEAGLSVIINTIPEGAPYWVYEGKENALYETADGLKIKPGGPANIPSGGWPGLCMDNPEFAGLVARFIRETARHYRDENAVEIIDVWNEPHLEPMYDYRSNILCYCEYSKEEFRKWLKNKYQTIEELNKKWIRTYQNWDQVTPPLRFGTWTDMNDWRMFWLDNLRRWMKIRVTAAKEGAPEKKVQSHVAYSGILGNRIVGGLANELGDEFLLTREVDYFGLSSFPKWLMGEENAYRHLIHNEMIAEAAHGKLFYQVELQGGGGKPGLLGGEVPTAEDVRIWNWNTVAAGGKGSVYWQYAPEPAGIESPGFGLTGFRGEDTARSLSAKHMAVQLNQQILDKAVRIPAVNGIYVSRKSDVLCYSADRSEEMYAGGLSGVFKAAYMSGIPIRFVHEDHIEELLNGHIRFLYLPMTLVVSDKERKILYQYVKNGGTLVSEACPGLYRPDGLLDQEAHALNELFGAEHKEIQALKKDQQVTIHWKTDLKEEKDIHGMFYRQLIIPGQDAQVLAEFEDGEPAVISRKIGSGQAVWIGTYVSYQYEHTDYEDWGNRKFLTKWMDHAGYPLWKRISLDQVEKTKIALAPLIRLLETDEEYVICGVNHQPHNCNILVEWENDKYPAVNLMIPAEDGVLYRVNKE